jgi:hypothetical protein
VDLKNQIEFERQKRIIEKANADEQEIVAKMRKELENTKKEVEDRKIAVERKEIEIERKEIEVERKEIAADSKAKEWERRERNRRTELEAAAKKLRADKILLCNQLFEKETAIRVREIRVAEREGKLGPLSVEDLDAEVVRAQKRHERKSV